MIKAKYIMIRDTGHNNAVKREHLEIYKLDLPTYLEDAVPVLQKIADKIEHKFERCEKFLSENKDEVSLSYYTEGYYNGRARAFEDIIDVITDVIKVAYEKEYRQ
nr:MAG TPA: hypothetical protein [Crassvirales sp.]